MEVPLIDMLSIVGSFVLSAIFSEASPTRPQMSKYLYFCTEKDIGKDIGKHHMREHHSVSIIVSLISPLNTLNYPEKSIIPYLSKLRDGQQLRCVELSESGTTHVVQ